MLDMLIAFVIGLLVGAVGMYLVCRNSPKHFEEVKGKIDEAVDKIKTEINK